MMKLIQISKQSLKKILPEKVVYRINQFRISRKLKTHFLYDFERYSTFSDTYDTEESMIAAIALTCHGLEKGFTMPDFRVGFGESKLKELLSQCRKFIAKYGKTSHQLRLVIQVIYEYRLCHQRLNAKVPESVAADIDSLSAEFPDIHSDHVQIETNKTEYFSQVEKSFPEFARSRHSVRDFSPEPVSVEKIKKAIALAQCAPSACNRQSAVSSLLRIRKK